MPKFEYNFDNNDRLYTEYCKNIMGEVARHMKFEKCNLSRDYSCYHLRYMRKDEQGNISDEPVVTDGQSFNYGTIGAEFIESLKKGEVYMYPNESKQPVKLSIMATSAPDVTNKLLFSVETTPVKLDAPKPGFFKRWFNSWFGAFQKDFDAYHESQKWQERVANSDARRTQEIGDGEKAAYEKNEKIDALKTTLENRGKAADTLDNCLNRMENIMGPTTVPDPTLIKYDVIKSDYHLDPYEKPEMFSNLEASEIAFAAYADPANGGQTVAQNIGDPNVDVHGNYSFVVEGFFAAYRQNIGERGYNTGLNSARAAAADAMKKFAEGDPKDLARLLSTAIKENNLNINQKNTFSETVAGYAKMNGGLLDLMNKHPSLKETALKEGYINQDELDFASGAREYVGIVERKLHDDIKITQSLLEGKELTHDEITDINRTRFQIHAISSEMKNNQDTWVTSEEYKTKFKTMQVEINNAYKSGDYLRGQKLALEGERLKSSGIPLCQSIKDLSKPGTLQKLTKEAMDSPIFKQQNKLSTVELQNVSNSDVATRFNVEIKMSRKPAEPVKKDPVAGVKVEKTFVK